MLPGLAIALAILTVALFLIAPLFTHSIPPPAVSAERERADLAARQASVLATLKDLDFDLATGKISPEDHRELRERYTAEAVGLMQRIEALAHPRAAR